MDLLLLTEAAELLNDDGYTCGPPDNIRAALDKTDIAVVDTAGGEAFDAAKLDLIRERFDTQVVIEFDGTEPGPDGVVPFEELEAELAAAVEIGRPVRAWRLRRSLNKVRRSYAKALTSASYRVARVADTKLWVMPIAGGANRNKTNAPRVITPDPTTGKSILDLVREETVSRVLEPEM